MPGKKTIYHLFLFLMTASLAYSQAVGIGSSSFTPASMLSVKGNLSVGSGYETTAAPTDGLIIKGNVGIGTTSPGDMFHLKKDANSQGAAIIENADVGTAAGTMLQIRNSTALQDALRLQATGTAFNTNGGFTQDCGVVSAEANLSGGLSIMTRANATIRFYTNGHTNERMRIDGTGNVGIGTTNPGYKLEVNGRLKTTGVNESSDIRYKKDVTTLSDALNKVMQLRGVNYLWDIAAFNNHGFDSTLQMGLIAQEVEKIIPEVVRTDAAGFKSVEYSKIVALLIEALKQQQEQINSLWLLNNKIMERMNQLKITTSNAPFCCQ